MDLSSTYLGLKLKNPLMPGASPLSDDTDIVQKLQDHGAAAIVMHSIYQEQIAGHQPVTAWDGLGSPKMSAAAQYPSSGAFAHTPSQYLDRIETLKSLLKIPLIASINCTTCGTWTKFAELIEAAGANALELNVYRLPTDPEESGADVEKSVVDIVAAVRQQIQIPLAVKLSASYSALPHFAKQLAGAGASGLVLFNRFYQADFDVTTKMANQSLDLSTMHDPMELRLRLRWLAILSPQIDLSLALTGGVHTPLDAIKGIMAGASAIQMVSSLLNAGPTYLDTMIEGLENYVRDAGVTSLEQLRGCMNHASCSDPSSFERGSYLSILHKWKTGARVTAGLHQY